jgi:hypothetical protein
LQVIQMLRDAAKITHAVAIAVAEAARVDLVDHCVLPPWVGCRMRHNGREGKGDAQGESADDR